MPFVVSVPVHGGPAGYLTQFNEGVCGLLVTFPFLGLAFAFPLAWGERKTEEARPLRAMIGAVAVFGGTMLAVVCGYFLATARYMADFAPALGLLAVFGWLGVERRAQARGWNRFIAPVIAVAGAATAVAGVLVSFGYHELLLRTLQPQLWGKMERFCDSLMRF